MLITTRFAARLAAVAVPAALAVMGFAGAAQAAAAPTVACGATLTSNATLTKNLTCATGQGVTLGKNVVLDLGGYKLVGPGSTGTAVTFAANGGSAVKNGTIQGWGTGVSANGEDATATVVANKVTKVTLTSAPVSVYFSALTVADSSLTNSPVDSSASTFTSTNTKFTKSSVDGWQSQISLSGATVVGGNVSDSYAFGVKIDKSSLDGTGFAGPLSSCSETDVTITNSTVKNYSAPISGYWCTATLSGNTFTANKGGVLGDISDGMGSSAGVATISKNTFKTSGIALDSGAMKVTGNIFTGNTTGVIAEDPAHTTITGNTFASNTSSGVRASSAGLSLGTNKATNNGRYGINAPGAVNLGGNTASGNPLGDCLGVACTKA